MLLPGWEWNPESVLTALTELVAAVLHSRIGGQGVQQDWEQSSEQHLAVQPRAGTWGGSAKEESRLRKKSLWCHSSLENVWK